MAPRQADLRPYKDQITRWYLDDEISQDEILQKLRDHHNFHTSERTLQRRLREWGLYQREQNIAYIEEEILQLFRVGLSYDRIVTYLREERPDVKLSKRSLERKLQEWGQVRYEPVFYPPELVDHIRYFVYHQNIRDKEILEQLRGIWGIDISIALLVRIRLENDMRRRTDDPERRQNIEAQLHQFFESYQHRSDLLGNLGRDQIHGIVRRHTKLDVTRDMAFEVYRQWYPVAVRQRRERRQFQRERREAIFAVPGPNYMWSMDGYQKLRFAGFEIYAGIDAYSRKMLWINVSRSNSLPANVLNQYLLTVTKLGFRPWLTRTDHGVETPLMAHAQFHLATFSKPSIVMVNPDGTETVWRQGYNITDSHKWGSSRQNRKIEQWWAQLFKSVTKRWIDYFKSLSLEGDFDKNETPDQVALYAIYGDIIREECAEFMEQWNNHRIKFQSGKNHVTTGHVHHMWLNVGNSGIDNFAIEIRDEEGLELMQLAQKLREPLLRYDLDSFLRPETQQVCDEWLARNPLGPANHDVARPHRDHYLALRDYLRQYEAQGREPRLTLNEMPRGGARWYISELQGLQYAPNQLQEEIDELEAARREAQMNPDEYAAWFEMDIRDAR